MSVTAIKRPNYYEGQYLGAQDFVAAQEYQRQQDQRHRLAAHTWGIAAGLEIDERPVPGEPDAVDVYIKPGYAVDGFGRSLIVLQPYQIPPALFAQFTAEMAPPEGVWVPVWIRFREEKTDSPRPGFDLCGVSDRALRILETFRVIVGELPSLAERRDKISIAGILTDADTAVPDASIAFQELPDAGDVSRWFIRVGCVRWQPARPPQSTIGHFVKSATDVNRGKVREGRPYLGAVAESILAPAGKLRIRDRFKPASPLLETSHFAAIEGSLRVDGEAYYRGKVGIGTPAPQQGLSVNAAINLDQANLNDGTLNPGITFGSSSGEGIASKRTTGGNQWGLDFYTGSAPRLSIVSGGSIGVGTTTPDRALTIQSPAGTYLNVKADNGVHEVLVGADGNGGILSTMTNHDLQLRAGGNLTKVVVRAGGNVGIGVPAPEAKLQIAGDLALHSMGGGGPRNLPAGATLIWNDATWLRLNQNLDFGKPIFGVHTPGVFAPGSLNVGGGGNWGDPGFGNAWISGSLAVGNTNPTGKMTIRGMGPPQGLPTEQGALTLFSRDADFLYDGGGDGLFVFRDLGGKTAFIGGNVGIGTSQPGYKLDVAGGVHASNGFWWLSDRRVKANVMPLTDVLKKVCAIRGACFELRQDKAPKDRVQHQVEIGVVAQEIETVFPELVAKQEDEGLLAVDYGRLSAVLVEAVKELAVLTAGLTERMEKLEAQIVVTKGRRKTTGKEGR